MELTDIQLYKKLNKKHPVYTTWQKEWEKYSDVWGDKEPFEKTKYLVRGKKENKNLYENRVDLAEFIPESPLAIDKIVGALYTTRPTRDLPPVLDDFCKDVTMSGENIDEFMETVAGTLLAYGTHRLLVNNHNGEAAAIPADSDDETPRPKLSVAEQRELGIRPFVIRYTPDQIIDWETDKVGNLTRVRIREESTMWDKDTYDHIPVHKFIQYTRDTMQWWTFKKESAKQWSLVQSETMNARNELGEIPMVAPHLKYIRPMVGKSYIRYASSADLQKFRAESDMIYDAHQHSHYTLVVKTAREMREIGVGTNTYLKLNPADQESAEYLKLPKSAFESQKAIVEDRTNAIYRQAKTDPLGVFQPGQSQFLASGAARAWSFGTSEARLLNHLAMKMEDIEKAIFILALKFMGEEDEIDKIDIKYPKEFDMSAGTQLIEDTEKIEDMINSPLLTRILHKRIASSKAGMSDKINDIYAEIDNNPLYVDMNKASPPDPENIDLSDNEDIDQ